MPAPISREYRVYLALWRKAYLNPDEPVIVKCSSRNMAIAMRQGMYRAIRPFREGKLSDEELRKAAEKFVVFLKDDSFEIRPRIALQELEGMFDQIGLDEQDLLVGDERAALDSLNKLLDGANVNIARKATPFYTREAE